MTRRASLPRSQTQRRAADGDARGPARGDIRAVTFDVGGTLIQPWPSVGHIYAEVGARFGLEGFSAALLNRRFVNAWNARRDFDYSRAAWRGVVNATFAGLSPEPPSRACFEALYERFGHARAWRIFDDVLPALAELKSRDFRLGLISNWDERLRPLLDELGLLSRFDAVAISHETGQTKPAPGIFNWIAARLDVSPQCVLHVGDDPAEDVIGARAAGMQSLLLDRQAARPGRRSRTADRPGLQQIAATTLTSLLRLLSA
jgi:putative hydrolase of the HAD superfamily